MWPNVGHCHLEMVNLGSAFVCRFSLSIPCFAGQVSQATESGCHLLKHPQAFSVFTPPGRFFLPKNPKSGTKRSSKCHERDPGVHLARPKVEQVMRLEPGDRARASFSARLGHKIGEGRGSFLKPDAWRRPRGYGSKCNHQGTAGLSLLVPFTRVSFWVRIFDPPCN